MKVRAAEEEGKKLEDEKAEKERKKKAEETEQAD